MLLHSVTPPHMIADGSMLPKYSVERIGHGYAELCETPDGLCMSSLHTTDLSMYLKPGYAPGAAFRGTEEREATGNISS